MCNSDIPVSTISKLVIVHGAVLTSSSSCLIEIDLESTRAVVCDLDRRVRARELEPLKNRFIRQQIAISAIDNKVELNISSSTK